MTLIRGSDSKVRTDVGLLKLSSAANALLEPVLRDPSVSTVIKTPVGYRKNLDLSDSVSFQEARVTGIARDLLSCGSIQGAVESDHIAKFELLN